MIAPFPRTPSRSHHTLKFTDPNILISKTSGNLKYHLLILLHCLSEVNDLAVFLLQHILEVAHRGVGGGGRRCELLVYRRRRALEGLPVP